VVGLAKLDAALSEAIADPERRAYADRPDPQGIGGIGSADSNGLGTDAVKAPAKTQ
jgi:hypothetical protein